MGQHTTSTRRHLHSHARTCAQSSFFILSFSLRWTLHLTFDIIQLSSSQHHFPSLLPLFIFPSVTIPPVLLSVWPALSPLDSFFSHNNKHRLRIVVRAKSNWLMKVSIDLAGGADLLVINSSTWKTYLHTRLVWQSSRAVYQWCKHCEAVNYC